jgi:hypothetical protein
MKYSGQPIPEWELEADGLKQPEAPAIEPEAPKRRGRPPKVQTTETEGTDE